MGAATGGYYTYSGIVCSGSGTRKLSTTTTPSREYRKGRRGGSLGLREQEGPNKSYNLIPKSSAVDGWLSRGDPETVRGHQNTQETVREHQNMQDDHRTSRTITAILMHHIKQDNR